MRGAALPWAIAVRYLFRRAGGNRRRTISAVAGIALAMVPLVLVMELADGMIRGITARYIETGTYHLQAYPGDSLEPEGLDRLVSELTAVDGVEHAGVEHRGVGLLSSETGKSGVQVRSVPPDLRDRDRGFREYLSVEAGAFDLDSDNSIVLGRFLAQELDAGVGDEIRLLTVRSLEGRSFLPRVSRFRVTGVVSTGYQELDRLWAFIPLQRGLQLLPAENSDTFIGVKIQEPYALQPALFGSPLPSLEDRRDESSAQATLGGVRDTLGEQWRLYSWYGLERSRYVSFQTTRNLLLFIMLLIVVVASVNVSSTLVLLVVEKEQEIAFMRTIGADPRLIQHIFLTAGAVIGVAGVGIGLLLGVLLAINVNELLVILEGVVNGFVRFLRGLFTAGEEATRILIFSREFYLERVPISLDPLELSLLAALAMALSLFAALIPARRGVQVYPLEMLRRK
ncbi:MAG: ABC transporter permease [Alkalispirochaetaceae bacterium]